MTQLVQLQQVVPKLEAEGYTVFAISYDPVERLAAFAERHDIEFPLLSDAGSEVIRAFGILNTDIDPDEPTAAGVFGIPYPGVYVIDEHGVVIDKDFGSHHTMRLSGQTLVQRVLGVPAEPQADVAVVASQGADLELEAFVVDAVMRLESISTVVCRLRVADGKHVYATGAPEQYTPITMQVTASGLRFGEQQWPKPDSHELKFLGTEVPVYDGEVVMTVPVAVTSELVRTGDELSQDTVQIVVECRYQACDDNSCSLPTTLTTTLTVPIADMHRNDDRKSST